MARVSVPFLPLLVAVCVGCLDWPEELMQPDSAASDTPGSCPAICTNSCSRGVCEIDCRKNACACPAGYPCEVHCDGNGQCPSSIDCTQATRCAVHCEGDNTCAGLITCGPGFCSVQCLGPSSCAGGVDCRASCGCAVQNASSSSVLCPAACKNGCRTLNSCDDCS